MSTIKVDTLQTRAGSTAAVTGAGFVATDQIKGNTTATTVTLPTTTNIGATAIVSASAGSATIIAEGGTVTTNIQQGLAKAWARIDGTGTAALDDSFNCASLTDNGTGDYSVAITNDMSSVDTYYVIDGQYINSATTNGVDWGNSSAAVVRYKVFDSSLTDRDPVGFACIGDLA
jgi:hypothetical protein